MTNETRILSRHLRELEYLHEEEVGPEGMVEAKDPSMSLGFAYMLEPDPIFVASAPARPATSPPPPLIVLESLLPSRPIGFEPRVRIQRKFT